MRRYETTLIIDPDLQDDGKTAIIKRIEEMIEKYGSIILTDEIGSKKLAYDVKKKTHGYYVFFDYCGDGKLVNEIERIFRINENVLKYMTILVDKNADIDRIKKETEEAKETSDKPAEDEIADSETDTGESQNDENTEE